MGGRLFTVYIGHSDLATAFSQARQQDRQYREPHTIASKTECVPLPTDRPLARQEAEALADKLLRSLDPAVPDHYSPACRALAVEHDGVRVGWVLFGWVLFGWVEDSS